MLSLCNISSLIPLIRESEVILQAWSSNVISGKALFFRFLTPSSVILSSLNVPPLPPSMCFINSRKSKKSHLNLKRCSLPNTQSLFSHFPSSVYSNKKENKQKINRNIDKRKKVFQIPILCVLTALLYALLRIEAKV